jgi:drug/metabolite transporter (DMT)-like permease
MLKKLPNPYELTGVIGGLAFLMLLFKDGLDRNFSLKHLLLWSTVPLCYSIGNTLVKMKFQQHRPLTVTCLALSISGIVLVPASVTVETVQVNEQFLFSLSSLILLGIISTGLTTAMFYILIYRSGPLSAGMVGYVVPFVALMWGWLDGEPITWLQIIALIGILGMVALAQKKPAKA